MRKWQVLTVVPNGARHFLVTFLLDDREKWTVNLDSTFGLDDAISRAGVLLANQPPRVAARIGSAPAK